MRKPNAGMLEAAAREHGFDLKRSWMVGDRMTDVEAGHRAKMRTALILGTGGPAQHIEEEKYAAPTVIGRSLDEIAHLILQDDARA